MAIDFNAMTHQHYRVEINTNIETPITGDELRAIGFRTTEHGCHLWEFGGYELRWMCFGDETSKITKDFQGAVWELYQPNCSCVRMEGILQPQVMADIWRLIQKMKERGS